MLKCACDDKKKLKIMCIYRENG